MKMLNVLVDSEALAREAAARFVAAASQAIGARGVFIAALSGGTTPRLMFEHLAAPSVATGVDWRRTVFFWGDERDVPADDAQSNYGMARESLLRYVPIPAANIHRVRTETGTAAAAAREYETELRQLVATFPACAASDGWPRFDFILLGLGEDGHTASLFPDGEVRGAAPGAAAAHGSGSGSNTGSGSGAARPWVIAPWVPHLQASRISFTAELIDRAREIVFLVSGPKKSEVVARILTTPAHDRAALARRHPAARIEGQVDTQIFWLLDQEAARLLPKGRAYPMAIDF